MSDGARLDGLEAALQLRAPLLWNDTGRPPEPPLPSAPDRLRELADDEGAALATIEREVDALVAVYPHAESLRELGPRAIRERILADPYPIPTPADREGYFDIGELVYWLSGLADRLLVEQIAADRQSQLASSQRLLDLGCASGRALRHFLDLTPGIELVGIDLGAHHVEWARRHLPPSIVIAFGTTIPSLPLEDRSVDVVTGFSLMTHVADFEETLLLELRRVLRPGGFVLATFHPARLWADICGPQHVLRSIILGAPHRMEPPGIEPVTAETLTGPVPADRVVFRNLEWPVYNTNVLHSEAWIRERWGRLLTVERIVPRAHGRHQDAAILSRPLRP